MTEKISKCVRAMKHKGFISDDKLSRDKNPRWNNPHPYLFYTDFDGTVFYHICTFYSEKGWKTEFNNKELASMARELHFSSRSEFERFIKCPKKREEYHSELGAQKFI